MEDRLREIIITLTNRCNLKCIMCQVPQAQGKPEMTTGEVKGLIDDALNLNPTSIVFSGGEPLLRRDIFELISFANQRKINTCLTSNGTLIDEVIAEKLASSGIGVVNISIDGPETIHDSLRGRGTFNKAVQALKQLSCYKIETTIATIVCRQNYKALAYVMELAYRFGATTVKFQPFSEIFLIDKKAKERFFCSRKAMGAIGLNIDKVIELSKAYKIATNPLNYLYSIPPYICGFGLKYSPGTACPALWSSCPITAEGNVYPCWVFSDKLLGNIKETKLSKIWNSGEHNRLRRLIIREGCCGCLMSCYDYGLGKDNLKYAFSLKVSTLKKPKFFKKQYYRFYQYVRYISKKIMRLLFLNLSLFSSKGNPQLFDIPGEIAKAKEMLKRKIAALDKDEGS